MRIAHLVPVDINRPVVSASSGLQDRLPESRRQDPLDPVATANPTPSNQAKSAADKAGAGSGNPSDDAPQLEVIREILAQGVSSSSTINEKANEQSAVVDTILDELRKLELYALDRIEHISRDFSQQQSQLPTVGTSSAHLTAQDTVLIPALSSKSDDTTRDKGAFHRALRLAFLVLRADVVTVDPRSKCLPPSSKGEDIQVAVDETFFGLIPYLHEPRVDLPPLYVYYKRGFVPSRGGKRRLVNKQKRRDTKEEKKPGSSSTRDDAQKDATDCVLRLRPDLPRNERRPAHQIIEGKTNGMLGSDTVPAFSLQNSSTERTAAIVKCRAAGEQEQEAEA